MSEPFYIRWSPSRFTPLPWAKQPCLSRRARGWTQTQAISVRLAPCPVWTEVLYCRLTNWDASLTSTAVQWTYFLRIESWLNGQPSAGELICVRGESDSMNFKFIPANLRFLKTTERFLSWKQQIWAHFIYHVELCCTRGQECPCLITP